MAPKATRCELRCPDPAANPYLAFAVMLAAGLDGIKKKMVAPEPIEDNIWELTPEEMKTRNIKTVASNLKEALDALKENSVIREALGEHCFEHFYAAKVDEWDRYRMSISQWELDEYLVKY